MNSTPQVLFARQPIFNRHHDVIGYELLFRNEDGQAIDIVDGSAASNNVLVNAFAELDIRSAINSRLAFVNFPRELLRTPPEFAKKHLVIEILESVTFDEHLEEDLKNLKSKGFKIALDDFVLVEQSNPLMNWVDIVKLDVLDLSTAQIREQVDRLESYNVELVAEKVETQEMYDLCLSLGFDYFQGYFFSKPQVISATKLPSSSQVMLQLLARINAEDVELIELNNIIHNDPVLSMKLLKLINSAFYRRSRTVDSIQQAVNLIGIDRLRSWITLLKLGELAKQTNELQREALVRAQFCMSLGEHITKAKLDSYFSMGLLSCLDAFFGRPLMDLIEPLPLDHEVKDALNHFHGTYGLVLKTVIDYNKGVWTNVEWLALAKAGLSVITVKQAYQTSIQYADDILQELGN